MTHPQPALASQPLHHRLLAAAAALAATGLLLLGLVDVSPSRHPMAQQQTTALRTVTVWLQPARVEPTLVDRAKPALTPSNPNRQRKPLRASAGAPVGREDAPQPAIRFIADPLPAAPVHGVGPGLATLPAPAASAHGGKSPDGAPAELRLDADVLRSTAASSRGHVQIMADAAGRGGAEPNHGTPARLSRAVGSAGRADCLAADQHGSLLSALSIIARAASGKCP